VASLNAVAAQKPREIAMRILLQWRAGRDFAEDILGDELAKSSVSGPDRGLCQELVYGVIRHKDTLNWLIRRKTDNRTQKDALLVLLQLGLYQLFWLDRVPNHAAVHETVQMAKEAGLGPQSGFVNAVLRGYVRERDTAEKALAELTIAEPAVGYSHPVWLCERWQNRWGSEKAAKLMDWNNWPPPTYARVNRLKTDGAKLAKAWDTEGVQFTACNFDWTDDGLVFRLDSHPPLAELPSFKDGLFYIQDPSTLLAVKVLNPQPGESVLDLCAAPGGKTTFIAQSMQNRGKILAQDVTDERLKLVQENCTRLGVTCATTEKSSVPHSAPRTPHFDKVIVDAPCSNTGVMRRRVDLRWRIRPEEITRLRSVQFELLNQAASRLKPGGVLVYSTCSLELEENQELVKRFLMGKQDFRLESERELFPFADGVDGAYVARLSAG
jgi:16S rRNA (cytosine967-C5)-methyltransferase